MAESDTNGRDQDDAAPAAQPATTAPAGPPLTITVQYLKDLSFENPGSPHSLANLNPAPNIDIDLNVEAHKLQDRTYEVVLKIRAEAKRDGQVFFLAEVQYAGVCVVGDVPEQHVQPLVTIEGPRLLFPFARQILADITQQGGFWPLLINPIDFARLYLENQAAAQASKA